MEPSRVTTAEADKALHVLDTIIFLKKTALFSAVQTSELRAVAMIAEELSFKSGDTIVKQEDLGDSLYIIREGGVVISRRLDAQKTIELAALTAGDSFGEMSVFDTEVRSASVIAQTDGSVMRISGDDLTEVILDNPAIATELLKLFVKRLRKANEAIETLSKNQQSVPAT